MEYYGTEAGFCSQTASLWQLVGYFLMIVKIIIPAVLIIMGIITLGKAVISNDEKESKKGYITIVRKIVTAVVIFFVPSIVTALFSIINEFNELKPDYNVCRKCMTNPYSDYCNNKVLAMQYDLDD